MARGVTLIKMLTDLRAEARISKLPGHNLTGRDQQVQALQRKQEWFWEEFDWPHLRVDRYIELQAGQRYYSLPADLDISRVQHIAVRTDGVEYQLMPGIYARDYAAYDSDLDARAWPVQRWQIAEDPSETPPSAPQIEVWPIPDQNYDATTLEGRLKVTGIRKLRNFVEDADTADLDDRLIVSHCAAEMLAAKGAEDAQLKLDQATKLYAKLTGALMKRKVYDMFGVRSHRAQHRIPIAVYRAP